MIVAVGTDIVDHKSISRLNWIEKPDLLNRVFSEQELNLFFKSKKNHFLYGRFAVKEAILKCLGTGMIDGIALPDIQVLQNSDGQPVVNLVGFVGEIAATKNITKWHVSISHSDFCSIAFVIAEC